MFGFVSLRGRAQVLLAAVGAISITTAVSAQSLLSDDFVDNPIGSRSTVVGDASRFTYDATGDRVVAAYDTGLSTTTLQFALGQTLDQDDSFRFEADFEIFSAGLFADPGGFAQLAFGLINQSTTGGNRSGGGSGGDAFDLVTFDYFPNVSPSFGGPTLAPTIIESDNSSGFFGQINGIFGAESSLDDEGPLPLDTALTASVTYLAGQSLTLELRQGSTPVDINSLGGANVVGGADGLINTIQLDLSGQTDLAFSVDTFAITLFNDSFAFPADSSSVIADVAFDRVSVEVVPEPTSLSLLAIASGVLMRRRRHA